MRAVYGSTKIRTEFFPRTPKHLVRGQWSLLHLATCAPSPREDCGALVRLLVAQGCEIEAKTSVETLWDIFQTPGKIDIRDNLLCTPMGFAAFLNCESLACMRALLECGADINGGASLATRRSTPLHFALRHAIEDWPAPSAAFEFLLKSWALLDCQNEAGNTPLAVAIHFPQIVQALLAHGADANARLGSPEIGWRTPLHKACDVWRGGNPEVVKMLLAHGATQSIDCLNQNGDTALMVALRYSRKNQPGINHIAEILLEHAASVNASTVLPFHTPLHIACQYAAVADVKLLLERSMHCSIGD
eukprot:m.216823 g.216823  ORF g.216823 m.216823 type:complete len:304 (-) comp10154_c1_seq36:693-1604(-)